MLQHETFANTQNETAPDGGAAAANIAATMNNKRLLEAATAPGGAALLMAQRARFQGNALLAGMMEKSAARSQAIHAEYEAADAARLTKTQEPEVAVDQPHTEQIDPAVIPIDDSYEAQ